MIRNSRLFTCILTSGMIFSFSSIGSPVTWGESVKIMEVSSTGSVPENTGEKDSGSTSEDSVESTAENIPENISEEMPQETVLPTAILREIRILPTEITEEENARSHVQILRSYKPGVLLESPHFLVEADENWSRNAQGLTQVIQKMEAVRHEAEMTAALWRNTASIRNEMQNSKISLTPEFSGEKLRLRVLTPGTHPAADIEISRSERFENLNPNSEKVCFFEKTEDNNVLLTMEIPSVQALEKAEVQTNLREEIFQTVLYDGREDSVFPLWLQTGLTAVFSGERFSGKIPTPIRISQLQAASENGSPLDFQFQSASELWLCYFLSGNDSRQFFPFFSELNRLYKQGIFALKTASPEEIQRLFSRQMEDFVRHGEQTPSNPMIPITAWVNAPELQEPAVFWTPSVPVLNAEVRENQPFSVAQLPSEWKNVIQEMAVILKITAIYQTQNTSREALVSGMKIVEFGKMKEFRALKKSDSYVKTEINNEEKEGKTVSDADEETENSKYEMSTKMNEVTEENSESESDAVTSEDIQRLEDVFQWVSDSRSDFQTLYPDGSLLSSRWNSERLTFLFHPKDRAYLLQEYEGKNVLSATFQDGSAIHVILEPAKDGSRPSVRVLGYEFPEKTEFSEENKE